MQLDQLTKNLCLPLPIAEHGFSALVNTLIRIEEKKENTKMTQNIPL